VILPVGAFVEGEMYPSWMQFFPSPLLHLLFLFFISFSFYFKVQLEDTALVWWPELTVLPTSTFTEMIRLARDETPFPLAMQPNVTSLAW
jgi:hypothetical protein